MASSRSTTVVVLRISLSLFSANVLLSALLSCHPRRSMKGRLEPPFSFPSPLSSSRGPLRASCVSGGEEPTTTSSLFSFGMEKSKAETKIEGNFRGAEMLGKFFHQLFIHVSRAHCTVRTEFTIRENLAGTNEGSSSSSLGPVET